MEIVKSKTAKIRAEAGLGPNNLWKAVQIANGKPENFKSEWKEVGPEKGYQRFDKGEEQNYSQLTIETKLLDGSSITQEMEINLDDMSRTDSFSNLSSGYDSTNSLDNIVSLSS